MSNSNSSGGIGIGGVLLIVFIVLKLCGVIAWSWWWVLSPLWIPIALWLAIVAIAGIFSSWSRLDIKNKNRTIERPAPR